KDGKSMGHNDLDMHRCHNRCQRICKLRGWKYI
ncbi:uncharacterized protein METZ01_LOCUS487638, partial [marine metagenome]